MDRENGEGAIMFEVRSVLGRVDFEEAASFVRIDCGAGYVNVRAFSHILNVCRN